ncbi:MAG: P-II family nitrogen regulator [Spirochaetales bacterium]|jgi:nitrogen regulatory protein PII 1|nr:P-II family nitrogen regulator [Spirochaetales bacterium]
MLMIRAIVRPEKADPVMAALMADGFPAVTRMNVSGRGKQRGIKIGDVTYDEIPKELLIMVVKDADKEFVVRKIMEIARTGKGSYGDGKIFVSPVEEVYTVSSGIKESPDDGVSALGPQPSPAEALP